MFVQLGQTLSRYGYMFLSFKADCQPANEATGGDMSKATAPPGATQNQSGTCPGQLYDQVDKLLEGTDTEKEEAYTILVKQETELAGSADFLWRYAKACYLQSGIEGARGNEEKKQELVYSSKDLAYKALELDSDNPVVHKWCAITLGSLNDYEPPQSKILNGFKFKEHIESAIQLCPTDSQLHYLLGRWCYGMYMMPWVKRQLAATLFATPPTATLEQALDCFMKAEQLNPGMRKINCLYIAKCHIEKWDYNMALEWLEQADKIPTLSRDDKISQIEVDTLLQKYSWYKK